MVWSRAPTVSSSEEAACFGGLQLGGLCAECARRIFAVFQSCGFEKLNQNETPSRLEHRVQPRVLMEQNSNSVRAPVPAASLPGCQRCEARGGGCRLWAAGWVRGAL